MHDTITCPECGHEIEITEALSSQLTEEIRKQLQADVNKRKIQLDKQADALKAKAQELEEAQKSVDEQVKTELAKERKKLEAEARKNAEDAIAVELEGVTTELEESKQKLKEAQKTELELRKKERDLQTRTEELELEVARTLDAERDKLKEQVKRQVSEEHQLKDAEKEKQIGDLRKQIDDLKRKAEQGSQQLQGEILELSLEDILGRSFPMDEIIPVPKGVHGGDVLQRVRDGLGTDCGCILWESKRTKNWSNGWLAKLRDDQRTAKAVQAILLTEAMPPDCDTFVSMEEVWVTGRSCMLGVVTAIRAGMIEVANATKAMQGRQSKMEVLYNYLAGPEFRNRVVGIVEAFSTMRTELESEKRSMQRIWAKREKQIDQALLSTSGMYGDMQGIFAGALGEIEALELPMLETKTDGEK